MTEPTNPPPRIWVDADATPAAVKEILYRTAARRAVEVAFVANYHLGVPRGPHLKSIQVSGGFDVADDYIAEQVRAGDLVITQDIPLAAQVIDKGAAVINNRGEEYTADNIRPRLNLRDFMDTMRSSGAHSGGPPPFGQREKQAFANALDRWLARR